MCSPSSFTSVTVNQTFGVYTLYILSLSGYDALWNNLVPKITIPIRNHHKFNTPGIFFSPVSIHMLML